MSSKVENHCSNRYKSWMALKQIGMERRKCMKKRGMRTTKSGRVIWKERWAEQTVLFAQAQPLVIPVRASYDGIYLGRAPQLRVWPSGLQVENNNYQKTNLSETCPKNGLTKYWRMNQNAEECLYSKRHIQPGSDITLTLGKAI